jgi:hypothetical protein
MTGDNDEPALALKTAIEAKTARRRKTAGGKKPAAEAQTTLNRLNRPPKSHSIQSNMCEDNSDSPEGQKRCVCQELAAVLVTDSGICFLQSQIAIVVRVLFIVFPKPECLIFSILTVFRCWVPVLWKKRNSRQKSRLRHQSRPPCARITATALKERTGAFVKSWQLCLSRIPGSVCSCRESRLLFGFCFVCSQNPNL